MKPVRLIRSALVVGSWTLLSRGAGFARDMMMAAYLGAGPAAEAFLVAFSLPNMFRRFFAEGAFNMAFVPMFAKKLQSGEDAKGFAEDAFGGMLAILTLFSLIGTALMPWLVWAMAAGFAGDERFDLAVLYGRIGFCYILFISLVALISGVLNTMGRFTEASFVPVLMNLLFIAAMWLAAQFGWDMGLTLAWTVPVAGIAQFALTWASAARVGYVLKPRRPKLTPELKRLFVIAAPAVLAGGVVQVNLLVGRQVASFTEGAVAWLAYADRLYQLPLGVVGIAIGTVLLPDLSRRLSANDLEGSRNSLNRATELSLALTLPAAVALMVMATPLIAVLYGRGEFGATDITNTALALAIYGAGLPAFVLQKTLQPLYYAREDTRRPFRFALISMFVNLGIAIGLQPLIGFAAAALATTLAGWFMVLQLWAGTRAMGEAARADARLLSRLWRILLACLVMGAVLYGLQIALQDLLSARGLRWPALGLLVISGMLSYFAAGFALRAFRLSDFKSALRRRG